MRIQMPRVGLAIMSTDEAGEAAFKHFMPAHIAVYTTRVAVDLAAYEKGEFSAVGGFETVAASFPPHPRLDLLAFSCTSGAIASGDSISDAFRCSHPGVPVVNPATAAVHFLRNHKYRRIALLTPYPTAIHRQVVDFLSSNGFVISSHSTMEILEDHLLAEIDIDELYKRGKLLVDEMQDVDCLFISCTAIGVAKYLDKLSEQIGRPVHASSQVFAWHCQIKLAELVGRG